MKKILITGGTVFVSRYVAEYFVSHHYDVYVLNRNKRLQVKGVHLIECDRHNLDIKLKEIHFDIVIDVTAYNASDILDLTNALGTFEKYIMVSSSAVYPETGIQPFVEESQLAENKFWGKYGTDKIAAEKMLLEKVPDAYILRPPYLYGSMNNVYREAFVFDCALKDRPFYLPKDGSMELQFFHVKDLCRFIELIIDTEPENHIFNVGNKKAITIKDWVDICYSCVGKKANYVNVYNDIEQRNYFSFYNYEYHLAVDKQYGLMTEILSMEEGLKEAYEWYKRNSDAVNRKPYLLYIEENLNAES